MTVVEKYFNAEKGESILFALVGLVAIVVAIYFLLKVKQPFYTGMAYPLIMVALLQLIVGSTIYIRSPKDIARVNNTRQTSPQKIASEEIPRMETVMKNFVFYRWIEIGLIAVGLFLWLFFPAASLWRGVGIGLMIQAGFMLGLDYFAESRGVVYLEFLKQVKS